MLLFLGGWHLMVFRGQSGNVRRCLKWSYKQWHFLSFANGRADVFNGFSDICRCILLPPILRRLMLLMPNFSAVKRFSFGHDDTNSCENDLRIVLTYILLHMHVNDFAYGFVAHEINMNLFPFKIFGKHFVRLNAVQQHLCTVKYHLLITLPFYIRAIKLWTL